MKRYVVLLLLLCLSSIGGTRTVEAAPRERCFAETGFCVSGAILSYWEHNGGLAVFGYPITAQKTETVEGTWTGPVQWFERDRLEDHGTEGVLAGRLGALTLELEGRPWQSLFPAEHSQQTGCEWFVVTHRNLCEPFLSYWKRNGGLQRFGYPITPAFEETTALDGGKTWRGTVQYFERRRMEFHPELAGTPHAVLLGLLGRSVLSGTPCGRVQIAAMDRVVADQRSMLGCPTVVAKNLTLAYQPFEQGWMIWSPTAIDGQPLIYVITRTPRGALSYQIFVDTYREGEPIGTVDAPPAGKVAPVRGFGKLWRSNETVRQRLGWAIGPETTEAGASAFFAHNNAWMIYRASIDQVTVMYPNGSAMDMR